MNMLPDRIFTCRYHSPLGGIVLASDGKVLTGLWFDGQKHVPHHLTADSTGSELPVFRQAVKWLGIYFGGGVPDFTPPFSVQTTPFRRAV